MEVYGIEEKRAIESFKNYLDYVEINNFRKMDRDKYLEILLNLIEKQSKMIDLMAEQLTSPINGKEWVIKYYEDRVENEKNV